jgi:glycosyltransferase involved in cell wall biosynthesis
MLTAAGVLTLLIWLYLFLLHGQFWRISRILVPGSNRVTGAARSSTAVEATSLRITVVIPARDEADVVGRCVTSLLRQQGGSNVLHIFLVDDASSDATAEIARTAAQAAGKAEQLTVIAGRPLVPGWSGKLWAVQQGIEKAREWQPSNTQHDVVSKQSPGLESETRPCRVSTPGSLTPSTADRTAGGPDFFLLTDADIEHSPDSIATLVAIAQSGRYDLVSFMVKLYCRTLAERALIPAFVFFFLKLYPPAWIANPRRSMAGAAGGSILIRPEALARAGGIEAIRGEVIDDCALARRVKESGGKIWLGMAKETRSIRSYGSFAGIGRMISRGAFNQLKHSAWMLLLAVVGLTATYLLPPLLAIFSHRMTPALLGAAAWALMAACFYPMVRFYRLSPLWVVALPLVAVFYMGAAVHSAIRYWSGRGGQWKGRVQDPG